MKYADTEVDLIDSELIRKKFAGTYLVKGGNSFALIEVSTSHAIPLILERLKKLKIDIEQIKYIFITHIHLDHASGAGGLLRELPNAELVVHPAGAKHMADPSKLIAGAEAVYGKDVVEKDYGQILPIPTDRIIECSDMQEFQLGDRVLTTLFTPGHARHHISIFDNKYSGMFTGDSFGLSYPEMDVDNRRFYQPTTTPTAFEFDKMLNSLKKMIDLNPNRVYFTHYGISNKPKEMEEQITKRLYDYKSMVEDLDPLSKNRIYDMEQKLGEYYLQEAKEHGSVLDKNKILKLFEIDIKLNAMGLIIWHDRM
ncbi:MAG: MBL fold metallo-hydrolase [Spirochaetaceae bacterium]